MQDIDLAPNARAQQHIRHVLAESIRSYDNEVRDIDALSERLTVVWGYTHTHAFTFDHAEIEWILEGLDCLRARNHNARTELREGIAEIDRTRANNAAIRAAGY